MKIAYLPLLLGFGLIGCSSHGIKPLPETPPSGLVTAPMLSAQPAQVIKVDSLPRQPVEMVPSQTINRHIKYLVQDLIANLDYASDQSVFGVTTFTFANSDLKTAPDYAPHIAESIQHELHMFGIHLVEFKSTGALAVTPTGDFFLSRDYRELKGGVAINYVVTGTLSELEDEVLINAKVVGVNSMAVVATAQAAIPQELLERFKANTQIPVNRLNTMR